MNTSQSRRWPVNIAKIHLLFFIFLVLVGPTISIAAENHTMDVEFSFTAPDDPAKQLLGYRLYKEGEQVCETNDPNVSRITCDLFTEDGTFNFTLTARYSDGTESPHSPSFPFTIGSATPVPLQAIIVPSPSTGEVPLNVNFDGTDSTGEIATYTWDFGDGQSDTGLIASHTYSDPGTYTATLYVVDQSGDSQQTTTVITAQTGTSAAEPPTAVITPATVTGISPFAVTFNGESSTTPNSSIVSYTWSFGDGSQATGATISHTFASVGTYTVTLQVMDNAGQSDETNTQITANAPPLNENQPPISMFSMTQNLGVPPLSITFDASASIDMNDSGLDYDFIWNFGDGTSGSGISVQHIYYNTGIYTATLTVRDSSNMAATSSKTISVATVDQYRQERAARTIQIVNSLLLLRAEK